MVRKHSYLLLVFVATFGLCYLCLVVINPQPKATNVRLVSVVKQVPKQAQVNEPSEDRSHKIHTLLAQAAELQQRGLSDDAEVIYKKILDDETLLEAHDPLRVTVLRSYAKWLIKRGRTQEANEIIQRSKQIPVRRKIDNHPDRAHIS